MVSSNTCAHSFLVTAVLGPMVGLQFISSWNKEKRVQSRHTILRKPTTCVYRIYSKQCAPYTRTVFTRKRAAALCKVFDFLMRLLFEGGASTGEVVIERHNCVLQKTITITTPFKISLSPLDRKQVASSVSNPLLHWHSSITRPYRAQTLQEKCCIVIKRCSVYLRAVL